MNFCGRPIEHSQGNAFLDCNVFQRIATNVATFALNLWEVMPFCRTGNETVPFPFFEETFYRIDPEMKICPYPERLTRNVLQDAATYKAYEPFEAIKDTSITPPSNNVRGTVSSAIPTEFWQASVRAYLNEPRG